MSDLAMRRLRFSKEADNWLRVLKSRTGITPNVLCRIGFCLSLHESGVPDNDRFPEDSDREINRYTLLGEHDYLYVALLKERLRRDAGPLPELLDDDFRAHVHRGVLLMASRVKNLQHLADEVNRVRQSQIVPA